MRPRDGISTASSLDSSSLFPVNVSVVPISEMGKQPLDCQNKYAMGIFMIE